MRLSNQGSPRRSASHTTHPRRVSTRVTSEQDQSTMPSVCVLSSETVSFLTFIQFFYYSGFPAKAK
jgi:hypothetical protein